MDANQTCELVLSCIRKSNLNFNIVESLIVTIKKSFIKNKDGSFRRSDLKTEDFSTKKQESKIPLQQTLGPTKNESILTNTTSQQYPFPNLVYKMQSFLPSLFNQPCTNLSQMNQTKFHQPLNSSTTFPQSGAQFPKVLIQPPTKSLEEFTYPLVHLLHHSPKRRKSQT